MGRLSKQKGAEFERLTCKLLSLWLSDLKREDLLWRSAMSGGRATVHKKAGKTTGISAHGGDIVATDPLGHRLTDKFSIECKNYADIELQKAVFRDTGNFTSFWEQVVNEARDSKRRPMLIAKQTRQPTLLMLDRKGSMFFRRWMRPKAIIVPDNLPTAHVFKFHDLINDVPANRALKA